MNFQEKYLHKIFLLEKKYIEVKYLYKTYIRLTEKELDTLFPLSACLPVATFDSQHERSNTFLDTVLVNHLHSLIVIDITTIIWQRKYFSRLVETSKEF